VSITSDKLFHTAAAPPCAWGFARSLRKTPLQRFHSIINGIERQANSCPVFGVAACSALFFSLAASAWVNKVAKGESSHNSEGLSFENGNIPRHAVV
jgi:hypothetical protein